MLSSLAYVKYACGANRRQLGALIQVERVDLHKLVRWHAFGFAHGLDVMSAKKNLAIESD